MTNKRAYYIEYPDKEMAVMIKQDDGEPKIETADHLAPEVFIAGLMVDGYETFAYTSEQYQSEVHEWKTNRRWQRIDPCKLKEVTLGVPGPDGKMYANRKQVRAGRVVEANEDHPRGQSFWGGDAGTNAVGECECGGALEVVPLPKEWADLDEALEDVLRKEAAPPERDA